VEEVQLREADDAGTAGAAVRAHCREERRTTAGEGWGRTNSSKARVD